MLNPRLPDFPTEWEDDELIAAIVGGRPAAPTIGLLGSTIERPQIRARLHTICALYAHAPTAAARTRLLDEMETMTLQVAATLAEELLEAGWRPDAPKR
jgi:hypothetical protein